ncbi:tripartite tricarboxylate transporter TctB family protein [Ammoniphilus sp. YIM 78166]|uniref:tripartite tricarboxylate transporter TctB family protein n=1 Tax=Ammoniphilus sp. YIM 78166 TaxID=1644106 RepID=UPI0014315926|nr:tripartite tricarboxylate transporter TctB family protein [Ammoniphilus sp. YIM 78166]
MIQVNEKTVFSGFIFLVAVVLLSSTGELRTDVASVPKLVGTLLLLFSGIQFANDLFPGVRRFFPLLNKKLTAEEAIGGEGVVDDSEETKEEKMARFIFISWLILFVLLIYLVNVIAAIAVCLLIYLKWISKETWKLSVLYSLVFTLAIYLIFVVALDIYYFV